MITIRRARFADLALLQRFEREFDRDQRRIVSRKLPELKPYLKRAPGRSKSFTKWMRKWLRWNKAIVLIAEANSKPVGFSASLIQTSPPFVLPKRFGFVGYLFVRLPYRGQGTSSLMMQETVRWFAKHNISHVGLTVIEGNQPARAIYEKWGFHDFSVFVWKRLRKGSPSLRSG